MAVAGDVAYAWSEFDGPANEAAALLARLGRRIWLAHESATREATLRS